MQKEPQKTLTEILAKLHTIPNSFPEREKKLLDSFYLESKITEQHAKDILKIISEYRNEIFREIRHYIKDVYLNLK